MATKVNCPFCAAVLRVPEKSLGKKGRCRACGKVFPVPFVVPTAEDTATDEDVIGWLGEAGAPQSRPPVKSSVEATRVSPAGGPRRAPSARPRPSHKSFPVRLGHVDDMGAFFLFDPKLLYDQDFRCSFPVKCIVCGGRRHLSVHVVIWSSKLPGRGQLGMRTSYAHTVYELDKLGALRGRELLGRLDLVENLPEPYCLPFPYYVCHACSAVGAVVPDVRTSEDGDGQVCELGISSLERAEEFADAVCGKDSRVHRQLHRARQQSDDDSWRGLPLAVRSRIKQWYRPQEGEHFVAYIPDADFAKTEAGTAGIVMTDRRLVYHKFAAQVVLPLTQEMTISRKKSGDRTRLEIASPGSKTAILAAGPAGTERLRKCLSQQGALAHWVV